MAIALAQALPSAGNSGSMLGSYRPTVSPFPPDFVHHSFSWTALLVVAVLLSAVAAIGVHWRWSAAGATRDGRRPVAQLPAWEWVMLLAVTACAAAVFLAPSYFRYTNYGVRSFDIGIYSHAFWNALHGNGLFNSPEGMDHLSNHASPGLYLLLPVYALAPNVFTLLALNGLALASTVIPAYLIARHTFGAAVSLGCLAVFLTNPALRSLNYDVHEVVFAVPLLMWAMLFLQCRRGGLMLLMLALAMLFKEDIGVLVCFIGAYILLFQRRPHIGVAVILLGVAWVVAGINIVVAYHGGTHDEFSTRYSQLGSNWREVLLSPVLRPAALAATVGSRAALDYLIMVLSPFGFLPLLAPKELLLSLSPLIVNILSTSEAMRSGTFHYEALLLPTLFFAFVVGVSRLSALTTAAAPRTGYVNTAIQAAVLIVLVVANVTLQRSLGRALLLGVDGDPARAELDAIVAQIPPDVPVVSPQNLQPHLSNRTVSAYLNNVDDFRTDRPPFHYAVLPSGANPPPPEYELAWQGHTYSLYRLRAGDVRDR